ncbi:DUF2891 family protein [Mycobacterium shinjukuense]|uniref:DUF2891 family protein n=1 Tax=Mycobacterium shinjukuense TaxID=398694 RepID=UPI001302032A|nr:DUF2891 family protein [Mycobacterium shinjukuense]MCV6986451.1 DUF2891 family protein [Mycobacterium shinjukuense]
MVRNDTANPVFHGCIDWHSAVHGNYALRVVARLTGDEQFVDVARSVMSTDGLRDELASIDEGRVSGELPYGFAWFLILDREAAVPEMAPLATTISSQLRRWITGGSELLASEYHNLSFAAFATAPAAQITRASRRKSPRTHGVSGAFPSAGAN